MSKLKLNNFDETILKDSLFQALKNSQQTRYLINLRAQQIVTEISKDVWVNELIHKLNSINDNFQQAEQKCLKLQIQLKKVKEKQEKRKKSLIRELKSQNQHNLNKFNVELLLRDQQNETLLQEIQTLTQNNIQLKEQNQNLYIQIQQKQTKIQTLAQEIQFFKQNIKSLQAKLQNSQFEFQKLFKNHQQQMQKHFVKNKMHLSENQQLKNQIIQMKQKIQNYEFKSKNNQEFQQKSYKLKGKMYEQKIDGFEKQLKKVVEQKQKIKKELIECEYNYSLVKKQIKGFKEKYKRFEEEYNQIKLHCIELQNQKAHLNQKYDKDIKQHKNNIKNLKSQYQTICNNKHNNFLKIISFFKNYLIELKSIRQQNIILKNFIIEKVNLLKEYSQTTVMKIVNHISTQLNQYFQQCILEIRKAREEQYLAKQETKLKNQIIEHLDKLLNNQAKSVYDLRSELRLKRKQQEKLRKKLRNHYNETDKKLQDFQRKYISILKDQY